MSKYIILKPDNNNKLIVIERGLTLEEAKNKYDSTYIIVEDFSE